MVSAKASISRLREANWSRALCTNSPATIGPFQIQRELGRGGSWGSQGTIVFAPSANGGLSIVSDAGGAPATVTTFATPGESHRVPQFLPDGERFLYFVLSTPADGVYAFDPAIKQSRLIMPGFAEALFIEPGFLVFARDENLMAQTFDLRHLEATGSARPIAAGVQYDKAKAFISGGISPRGTLIFQPVTPPARSKLAWMDRKGERTPVPAEPIAISDGARLSKDARRAVVTIASARAEASIVVVDLERGITTQIDDSAMTSGYGALWAPGEQAVIGCELLQGLQSFVTFPSGGGAGTRLLAGEPVFEIDACSITPDGKTMIFMSLPQRDKAGDIMTMSLGKDEPAKALMRTPDPEWSARLSPSGDILAYIVAKEEDIGATLKVVAYPTPSTPVLVSATPIFRICWWLIESELAWADTSGRMWSAAIAVKDGMLEVGVPTPLFDGKALENQTRVLDYDPQGRTIFGRGRG